MVTPNVNQRNEDTRWPKIFAMIRGADASGVSGTGKVLEGVVFDDGLTVVRWCAAGKPKSTELFATFSDFVIIHITSHPTNATEIVWMGDELEPESEIARRSVPPADE